MTVKELDALDDDLAAEAWQLYHESFRELNAYAAQRHLMTPAEFFEVMADKRVTKFLTLDDGGALAGLATFTNQLDAVPLIAPEYYERMWPTHFAQGRIFYIGFVAVAPAARKSGAFVEVFARFYQIADAVDGIVSLDVCTYNEKRHRLPQAIRAQLSRLSGGRSRAMRADVQTFWAFSMRGGGIPKEEAV